MGELSRRGSGPAGSAEQVGALLGISVKALIRGRLIETSMPCKTSDTRADLESNAEPHDNTDIDTVEFLANGGADRRRARRSPVFARVRGRPAAVTVRLSSLRLPAARTRRRRESRDFAGDVCGNRNDSRLRQDF
jgi:hypothetical protein